MKKPIKYAIAAAIAGLAFTFAPPPTMAQQINAAQGPIIAGRAIITVKASSADEAKQFARSIQNFTLDEQYGPYDMHNGEYLMRGDQTGPLKDPSGHLNHVAPDALLSPTATSQPGSPGTGVTHPQPVDPSLRNARPMPLPTIDQPSASSPGSQGDGTTHPQVVDPSLRDAKPMPLPAAK